MAATEKAREYAEGAVENLSDMALSLTNYWTSVRGGELPAGDKLAATFGDLLAKLSSNIALLVEEVEASGRGSTPLHGIPNPEPDVRIPMTGQVSWKDGNDTSDWDQRMYASYKAHIAAGAPVGKIVSDWAASPRGQHYLANVGGL